MYVCVYVRFQNLANVYLKRYPGLKTNIDAELAWYKVRSIDAVRYWNIKVAFLLIVIS